MLSLAGRRPGARLYAREDKPSHRSKTTSPSYLRPLHRSYRVEALGPDSIKPLVELGFWSKSVEVRRDSAAALSTLARNPDNLGTLGRSGALGATLSLLISTDDACVRDATLTLGQLVQCVELADRFMERTGGLETVLGLLRSPAPRPALVVVANLACQRGAADAIVARGGLRPLVARLRAPRHDIRNEAAGVVAGSRGARATGRRSARTARSSGRCSPCSRESSRTARRPSRPQPSGSSPRSRPGRPPRPHSSSTAA